mgnify:CR=1 FL=1
MADPATIDQVEINNLLSVKRPRSSYTARVAEFLKTYFVSNGIFTEQQFNDWLKPAGG